MSTSLFLQSLGDLRLHSSEGELLPRRRKELALLVVLAARSPSPIRRSELQALFWGDRDDEKAQNSLRRALLVLRRALAEEIVEVQRDDVRVPIGAIVLDVGEAERRYAEGHWRQAAELFKGDFLPDGESMGAGPFRVWLEAERARLAKLRTACFEHLVADLEASADWPGMVAAAERWSSLCPFDERAHLRLVEALALDKRVGQATAQASAFAARLRADGEEPSPNWKRSIAALGRDAPPDVTPVSDATNAAETPLPRAVAFRRIVEAWREARAGSARVITLEGDTPVATTELAREFGRWLVQTQRGVLVLRQAPRSSAPDAPSAFATLFAPVASARGLAGAAPPDLAVLALYVPGIRERFPTLSADPPSTDHAQAIARVLSVLAEEQPLALVVDDLGAFAPSTRALLSGIARHCTGAMLVLLSTGSAHSSEMRALISGGPGLYLRVQGDSLSPPIAARVRRTRARALAIAGLVVVISLGSGMPLMLRHMAPASPLLAVATIDMSAVPDSLKPFPLLLETSLGRVSQLRVLSDTRLREVMAQLATGRAPGSARADVHRAAAVAGASEVIDGILSRSPRGGLRLDLRRVDVKTGTTRAAFTIESADALDLVDLATERIAQGFDGRAPATRFATTSASLLAYGLYEQGLHAEEADDGATARRLYLSALGEDSTFAMAAYRAARLSQAPEIWALMARAARLASRSPERERLLIVANYSAAMQDPSQLAYAESLAVRYPAEPDGFLEYGNALMTAGRFAEAGNAYQRAALIDSLGMSAGAKRCVACEALSRDIYAQLLADSSRRAEATARGWLQRQPRSPFAHRALASVLTAQGRYDPALSELQVATTLTGGSRIPSSTLTDLWSRQGRFADVDKDWQNALASGTRNEQMDALETAVLSLRFQGRLREALAASVRLRELGRAAAPADRSPPNVVGVQAMVLFELGRYRESATLFDSLAARRDGPSPGRVGRDIAWRLSHAATGYALAGDTMRLRQLEDTVRVYGARSSYGRDQRLHWYVRGLRLRAQGDLASAADAFRRSLYSPVEGNARANLELVRTLIQLHRERSPETTRLLQAALAGPIGASGQYVNRTELHELLGQVYDAAGARDSALAEYRKVLAAWSSAEPPLRERRDAVRGRMEQLGAGAQNGSKQ